MKPSIVKIISADYTALVLVLVPIVTWGLYVAILTGLVGGEFGPGAGPVFLGMAAVSSVVCIPLLIWRLSIIFAMFRHGVPAKGEITRAFFYKDRGRVEYKYTFDGQQYQAGNPLHKTAKARALKEGDEIDLLVNPAKPNKAIIPDLYR
ncbi:MAG: DUF3592 domain-containing protein [Pirellulaceae bacterium]